MSNVVSLADRSEVWKVSYEFGDMIAYVSTRGRIKITIGDRIVVMDTIQSVDFMGRISKEFEDEFNVLFGSAT